MCYKNKLNGNILFVSSNYCSWYTLSPFIILNAIKKYISRDTKIFILGSSKAGFGSLLLGHLLGNSCDNEIFILAFSPQIVIYPFSENVASFSKAYIEYYKDIAEFRYCHDSVLQFGNINNLFSQKKHNINAFIYVGEDLDYDMKEINTIINFNTCHICIMPNVDSHFTLMFFYRDQNYFASSLKDLNTDDPRYKLFKKFNEIKQKNNYSLNDIIEESLKKNVLKLEK